MNTYLGAPSRQTLIIIASSTLPMNESKSAAVFRAISVRILKTCLGRDLPIPLMSPLNSVFISCVISVQMSSNFANKLHKLTPQQESIQTLTDWVFFHNKPELATVWMETVTAERHPDKLKTFFYLCNDIVQKCTKAEHHASAHYSRDFAAVLPRALAHIHNVCSGNPLGQGLFSSVARTLTIWHQRAVFPEREIEAFAGHLGLTVAQLAAAGAKPPHEQSRGTPVSGSASAVVARSPSTAAAAGPRSVDAESSSISRSRSIGEGAGSSSSSASRQPGVPAPVLALAQALLAEDPSAAGLTSALSPAVHRHVRAQLESLQEAVDSHITQLSSSSSSAAAAAAAAAGLPVGAAGAATGQGGEVDVSPAGLLRLLQRQRVLLGQQSLILDKLKALPYAPASAPGAAAAAAAAGVATGQAGGSPLLGSKRAREESTGEEKAASSTERLVSIGESIEANAAAAAAMEDAAGSGQGGQASPSLRGAFTLGAGDATPPLEAMQSD